MPFWSLLVVNNSEHCNLLTFLSCTKLGTGLPCYYGYSLVEPQFFHSRQTDVQHRMNKLYGFRRHPKGPLYKHNLSNIMACLCNYIHSIVSDAITHSCHTLTGIHAREWINNYTYLNVDVVHNPCPNQDSSLVNTSWWKRLNDNATLFGARLL